MAKWHFFYGDGRQTEDRIKSLPAPPPWRQFCQFEKLPDAEKEKIQERWQFLQDLANSETNQQGRKKGESFRIHTEKKGRKQELTEGAKAVLNAVNADLSSILCQG